MCLYVKKGATIKTAKTEIVVYKRLVKNNTAPFKDFKYKKNVFTKHVTLHLGGWHEHLVVNAGYHAYTTFEQAAQSLDRRGRCKIVAMVIPKGTEYVLGENNEVVASQLYTHDLKAIID